MSGGGYLIGITRHDQLGPVGGDHPDHLLVWTDKELVRLSDVSSHPQGEQRFQGNCLRQSHLEDGIGFHQPSDRGVNHIPRCTVCIIVGLEDRDRLP